MRLGGPPRILSSGFIAWNFPPRRVHEYSRPKLCLVQLHTRTGMFLGWHSGYTFPKVSLPTQCEFPRGGTSRVTTVTLVPREGNETLRLFATPLHAWERLASSQKLTLLCAGVPL